MKISLFKIFEQKSRIPAQIDMGRRLAGILGGGPVVKRTETIKD
jgi:hypothetical protein